MKSRPLSFVFRPPSAVLCLLLAVFCLLPSTLILTTGCSAIAAKQAGVTSPKAITFLAMQDTWLFAKGTFEAFAEECARGNERALSHRAEIDAQWERYRTVVLAATRGLRLGWTPTTPEEQAQLAFALIDLIRALGIEPRKADHV